MADLVGITVVTNIEGLDELEEALKEGSFRAVRKYLRRAEMHAALPLLKSAREFAPYETGRLEMEISRTSVVSEGALSIRVGPSRDAFYGLIQEFGTERAGKKHDQRVPALHWLENSAREVQDDVLREFYEALTDGLNDMKRGK